ncbi:GDSL-type esterase/lipase family protein [Phenylobacterium sp.]|uniref:GDSL-type esterase/lipase family protein n=1 Tax=Phenylobacterium sp. TaxID=1871053 RepID=UPI002D1FBE37|nr:GDSL-type esterase/lipase family protein [Phenylobacterium sp.]
MRLAMTGLLAAGLLAGVAQAQTPPPLPPIAGAVGMVDQPCPPGSFGRSAAMKALAQALSTGVPASPEVMAAYAKEGPERDRLAAWSAKNDFADLCRFRADDARLEKQGGVRVVFLGDSITELWGAADPGFFSDRIVNRGISGQTSSQLLLRFEQDVVALKPKTVHILIGTNDVAGNNGPERPEDLKNNLRAMVAVAKAHRIRVVLGAIPPAAVISWRPAIHPAGQIRELNAWIAAFAKAEGEGFVDYGPVLATPEGGMKPALSRDGVHPLKAGYDLMRPIAQAAVN